MGLDSIKLTKLVVRSFTHNKLTEKETRKMLDALRKKYWREGLDSFQEKVVLSSHMLFPDSKQERDDYIKEVLARLNRKT